MPKQFPSAKLDDDGDGREEGHTTRGRVPRQMQYPGLGGLPAPPAFSSPRESHGPGRGRGPNIIFFLAALSTTR
jgi:hypothetical protein